MKILHTLAMCCLAITAGCATHVHPTAQAASGEKISDYRQDFAQKIQINGLAYAGKVNDFLYRGSQPNPEGIKELKKLGVTTIVNLRGERQGLVRRERKQAEEQGIKLVNVRASGWSPPKNEEIVQFFDVLKERPRQKVYVHCWLGNDRTGVFIAAYRIGMEGWSGEKALAEMRYFRFKSFWHPAMINYIQAFRQRFEAAPAFAKFRKERHTPSSPQPMARIELTEPLESAQLPFSFVSELE